MSEKPTKIKQVQGKSDWKISFTSLDKDFTHPSVSADKTVFLAKL